MTFEALDQLAGAVEGPALDVAPRWAAAGCAVRGLASCEGEQREDKTTHAQQLHKVAPPRSNPKEPGLCHWKEWHNGDR